MRVAVAPEAEGAMNAIDWIWSAEELNQSVAHTAKQLMNKLHELSHGAGVVCICITGMTGLHHREPGCCGAVLYHSVLAELIADGIHVHL